MERNYYCLIAGLPDWKMDDRKPSMSTNSFRELLNDELHPADRKLVSLIYLPFDHQNILNRLYKREKPFDERGNLSPESVEQIADPLQLLYHEAQTGFPYLDDFLNQFFQEEGKPIRLVAERQLSEQWFELMRKSHNPFLSSYARFEQQTRNVFTALHGRKHRLDLDRNLVGEGDLLEALKKSRARDFGVSGEIDHMEQIIQIYEMPHLQERELRLDLLRWQFLDDITFFNYFSVEKVMAIVLKLMIAERWSHLEEQKGREMFNKLIADLQGSYDFPEEYKFSHGKK